MDAAASTGTGRGVLARLRLAMIAGVASAGCAVVVACLLADSPTVALLAIVMTVLVAASAAATARRAWGVAPAVAVGATLATAVLIAPWPLAAPEHPALLRRDVTIVAGGGRDAAAADSARPPAPWFGLVPERELVRLGVAFGLSRREFASAGGGALLEALYEGRDAPSRVLDSWLFDRAHCRVLLPRGEGPFPLLLFLHGHGGPFEVYATLLEPLVVEHGIAVALPSFGFGEWSSAAARERIGAVHAWLLATQPVRADRVVLAGLSAGAIGALQHFARDPSPFHGCVAISGVPLDAPPFGTALPPLHDAAVLLVAGAHDERIPIARVREVAATLREAGALVQLDVFDADHLLLLTERDTVLAAIAAACR